MTPKKPASLTRAEWKVMRIVWQLGACSARQVYTAAGEEHGWAASTVKTHLRRLVDKGFLATKTVGNSFEYRPRKSLQKSLFHAADHLLENTLEGAAGPLLAYMLERCELSEAEQAELRAMLDAADAGETEASLTSWLTAVSGLAETWAAHALTALVQGSLMLAVVALVWWPLRRRMSPQFAYALFLLVPLKLVLAVELPLPAEVARFVPTTWASRVVEQVGNDSVPAPVRATAPLAPPASLGEVETLLAQLRRPAVAAAPPEHAEPLEPVLFAGALSVSSPSPPDRVAPSALARWFATVPPATLAMFAWLLGASALLALFARAQLRLHKVLRAATPLDPRRLPLDYAALAHRAGLRRVPPLYESPAFAAPALAGLFRPRLVLPAGLARRLDPAQLSWALCHEFAHLRRADLWVALGQRLVQIVYFFHPAVWLAHAAADRYREYACDDAALLACGTSRRACGESFLTIVEQASRWRGARGPSSAAALAGMTVRKQTIRSRLMRILDKNREPRRGMTRAGYLLIGAAGLVLLPSVQAQQEPLPEPIEIVFEEPEPLEVVFELPVPLEIVFQEPEPFDLEVQNFTAPGAQQEPGLKERVARLERVMSSLASQQEQTTQMLHEVVEMLRDQQRQGLPQPREGPGFFDREVEANRRELERREMEAQYRDQQERDREQAHLEESGRGNDLESKARVIMIELERGQRELQLGEREMDMLRRRMDVQRDKMHQLEVTLEAHPDAQEIRERLESANTELVELRDRMSMQEQRLHMQHVENNELEEVLSDLMLEEMPRADVRDFEFAQTRDFESMIEMLSVQLAESSQRQARLEQRIADYQAKINELSAALDRERARKDGDR